MKKPRTDLYPFHSGSPTARALAMQQYGSPRSTVRTLGWSLLTVVLGAAGGFVLGACYLIGSSR